MNVFFRPALVLVSAVGTAVAPLPTSAQTFIGLVSGRGTEAIRLKADTLVRYTSSAGTVEDRDRFDSPPLVEVLTPGDVFTAGVSSRADPTSGLAKDYGSARVDFTYSNGGYALPDSLGIRLTIHGSAEEAMVGLDRPKPADLVIAAEISYVLLGEPDGGRFRLTLPEIPALHDPAHEMLVAELNGTGMSPIHLLPGSGPTTLELNGAANYVFSLGYTLSIPFGTDPDYVYDFGSGAFATESTVVPEPATVVPAATLAGLALLRLARRQRRTAPVTTQA